MIDPMNASSMMTDNVQMRPQRGQGGHGNASLSDEQKQLISDTLAEYDIDELTEEDAQSIISIFQESGIQPGKDLEEAMDSAGFDARTVGEMAGLGQQEGQSRQGPPPQDMASGLNLSEDSMQQLYSLLDQYYSDSTSSKDRSSLTESIQTLLASELGSDKNIFSAKA